jgi:hypothetical protein
VNVVSQHVLDARAVDELERQVRMKAAWEAYYGRAPKPLKVEAGWPDDNAQVNYARLIVDKGVSFLFGQDLTFELDEGERTPPEEWLDACWDANGKMLLLQKLALNGAVCGHVWAKLAPARVGEAHPRIIVLDPANVAVGLALDDIEQVEWYTIQYRAVDPRNGEPVVRRQWIERNGATWQITDEESRGAGSWATLSSAPWPYTWAPIVDCQNLPLPNEFWGLSDIEGDVLELNNSLNFVLSNLKRVIRFHAHPKTWARGVMDNELHVSPDEVIILQSENGELHNLEMQSDLSSSITLYDRLREALHEVSRVPEVATGKLDGIGALSGLALQILYQPLIEKTEVKRRTYGGLVVELNRRLLDLGGFGPDNVTALHWPEMLAADTMAERQTAIIDKELGVSRDTLLQQLGYDPDLESKKRQSEQAELGDSLLASFDRGEGE